MDKKEDQSDSETPRRQGEPPSLTEFIDRLIDGVGWNFELLVDNIEIRGELPSIGQLEESSPETDGESQADVRDQDRDHQDEASAESGDEKKADPEPAPEVTEKPNLKRRSPGENVPAKFRFFVEKADELFPPEKIVEDFSALIVDQDYDIAKIIRDLGADVHSGKFSKDDVALNPLRIKPRAFARWLRRDTNYRLRTGPGTPWVEMLLNVFEKIDEFIAGQAISETKQPKKRDTGAAVDDENLQFSPEAVSPSTSEEVEWESIDEIEKKIKKLAPLELSVLLLGETGTGKEYYARRIHENSKRSGKPSITVNCSTLPKGRVDSELFGHKKGAFTGATSDHPGKVRDAEGGTIFLDELGDLPEESWGNLLRFLQFKEIHPLGGPTEVVDVRVLAATNKRDMVPKEVRNRFNVLLTLPGSRLRRKSRA